MILTIDIGNTNIKFGFFENDQLIDSYRLSAAGNKTSDEFGFYLTSLMRRKSLPIEIEGAIMSSVNPNLNYTIVHMIEYYFDVKPLIVGTGIRTGLNIRYDNPKEVGSDRIVSSVAAFQTYGGPCIVIDCGTATTFNVLSGAGDFLGGAISFGLKAGADALNKSAVKLPGVELIRPPKMIAKTTITNMQSGLINGYIGMIEYIVGKIKLEMNAECKVVATGGVSEIVSGYSNVFDSIDRTLTLRGLNQIYKLNN